MDKNALAPKMTDAISLIPCYESLSLHDLITITSRPHHHHLNSLKSLIDKWPPYYLQVSHQLISLDFRTVRILTENHGNTIKLFDESTSPILYWGIVHEADQWLLNHSLLSFQRFRSRARFSKS
jgi:hypothetical protein